MFIRVGVCPTMTALGEGLLSMQSVDVIVLRYSTYTEFMSHVTGNWILV